MRLPSALTAGASVAAALVLLSGCGGDSEDPQASGSSAAASSSAAGPSASDEEVAGFCADAEAVLTDLNTAFDSASDPTQLPALLDQASAGLHSVQVPAQIAGSWTTFSGTIDQLAQVSRTVDLSTPQGLDRFTQEYDRLTTEATPAQQDVDSYVTANCPGASAGSTG
jgi:hypothetical protein